MFLRSAKNAGFDVPQQPIADAVGYVQRCFQFAVQHVHSPRDQPVNRIAAVAAWRVREFLRWPTPVCTTRKRLEHPASGCLSKALPITTKAATTHEPQWTDDRYHYGVFCSSQAMYQLGGEYWAQFFPPVAKVILDNQKPNGSWDPEAHTFDRDVW